MDAIIPSNRRWSLAALLGHATDWCVIAIITLTPVWFLPVTLDVLELNKQTLLLVLTSLALVAWFGQALAERSFSLARSWLHLAVFLFLAGYGITSWFSLDRYVSFVGNFGQMQWAFATVAALAVVYLLIVNRFRSAGSVYDLVLWFLLGCAVAGAYGALQLLGIHVIPGALANNTFNTIGTVNALGVFMVIPTILAASLTVLGCREKTCVLSRENWIGLFWRIVIWVALVIGAVVAILVDYWVVWAGLLFGTVLLTAIPFFRTRRFGRPITLIVPVALALISLLLLMFRTPLDVRVPSEVSPSAGHTWQIARQALRDAPLFGTGPGTWIYDYAKYRSVGANLSQFWEVRFERGISTLLTLPAMLGIVGMALWLLLVVSAIVASVTHLIREKNDDLWQAYLTVFVAWATLVFLAALYNYNVAHHVAFWFLLALLGVLVTKGEWAWEQRSRPALVTVLSVVVIIVGVSTLSVAWLAAQRLVADTKYSQAVQAFQRGDDPRAVIETLSAAVSLNRLNDAYERNLSQASLVLAGKIMADAASAEPGAEESFAKQAREAIAGAVEHAKRATEMSPANVDNWSNLASVYQAVMSFTKGADEAAIGAYQEALTREPNNPVFANEVGKLHVLRSDAYRAQLQSTDAALKAEAETNIKAELDQAADWFNRAITAKPDYAPAHFNLGLVYERQNRIDDAIAKLEQVLSADPNDVGVAFQLATLYGRAERKDEAKSLFEQIVAKQPDYANARWLLSAIYEEQGAYDLAIQQVEAVAATNPDVPDIIARLEALKKARDEKTPPSAAELAPMPEVITAPEQNPVQAP